MIAPRLRPTLVLCCTAILSLGAGCSHATATGAAGSAATGADRATFRGVYESGPDRSAFLPCGSGTQWYVSEAGAPARELRRRMSTQDLQSPGGGMLPPAREAVIRRAYAEVQGDTVAVSSGRAAAAYERELRVTKVLAVQPAQGGMCP